MPVATILEEARTVPNGDATSTSDANAVGGKVPAIIGAAAGLAVLLAIAFFFYWRYRKKAAETKRVTAVSELISGELGMLPMAPVATVQNIEAQLSASSAQRGKLCVDCGVMNEASNEICQDCRKSLHVKMWLMMKVLLFEQVSLNLISSDSLKFVFAFIL